MWSTTIAVRLCAAGDLPALGGTEPPGSGIARSLFRHQTRGHILFGAAWLAGKPAGTVVLDLGSPRTPELKHLYVQEGKRGGGVGTALCAWAEARAAGRGFELIHLGVGVDNHAARRLYLRLGYEPLGESDTTTYDYVDDAGTARTMTETSDLYVKELCGLPAGRAGQRSL